MNFSKKVSDENKSLKNSQSYNRWTRKWNMKYISYNMMQIDCHDMSPRNRVIFNCNRNLYLTLTRPPNKHWNRVRYNCATSTMTRGWTRTFITKLWILNFYSIQYSKVIKFNPRQFIHQYVILDFTLWMEILKYEGRAEDKALRASF